MRQDTSGCCLRKISLSFLACILYLFKAAFWSSDKAIGLAFSITACSIALVIEDVSILGSGQWSVIPQLLQELYN